MEARLGGFGPIVARLIERFKPEVVYLREPRTVTAFAGFAPA